MGEGAGGEVASQNQIKGMRIRRERNLRKMYRTELTVFFQPQTSGTLKAVWSPVPPSGGRNAPTQDEKHTPVVSKTKSFIYKIRGRAPITASSFERKKISRRPTGRLRTRRYIKARRLEINTPPS